MVNSLITPIMLRVLTIVLLLGSFGCSKKKPMPFDTLTRNLFFEADLANDNQELTAYYRKSPYLNLVPRDGSAIYPPLSALGNQQQVEQSTFEFTKHPFLAFSFLKGSIVLETNKQNAPQTHRGRYLKLFFQSKEDAVLAYTSLVSQYSGISDKKKLDSNVYGKTAQFSQNSGSTKEVSFTLNELQEMMNEYSIILMPENDLGDVADE